MKKIFLLASCTLLLIGASGCYQTELTRKVNMAQQKVAEAQAAGAEKAAPYEFEASKRWLDFAHHEANESDQAAAEYAKKANDYAEAALAKAKGGSK